MTRYIYLLFVAFLILLGIDILAGSQGSINERSIQNDLANLAVKESEDCRLRYEEEKHIFDYYEQDKGLKQRIIDYRGGAFAPYLKEDIKDLRAVDIEHLVARREAFYSGLCHESKATKLAFITSLPNLVLSVKYVNEVLKSDKDAAKWLPKFNQCFFVATVVRVKTLFKLSVDKKELNALKSVIDKCTSFELER